MSNIPVIDIIFSVLIVLMIIHGLLKGFIGELFSWAPIVMGICISIFLNPAAADFLRKRFFENVKFIPEILAFAAIFIIIILVLKLLERILRDIIVGAKLGGLDKLLGSLFGLVEGVALTAAILLVLTVQPIFDSTKVIGDSFYYHMLKTIIGIPLGRSGEVINQVYIMITGISFPV